MTAATSPPLPVPMLSRRQIFLMATACGVSVANICYNQPLLGDFAREFHATAREVGWVATATQAGYGLGILFLLPLGDLVDRRDLTVRLVFLCALFLAAAALSPGLAVLGAAHFLIGVTAINAQILIPFAADLSPKEERGRTVGVLFGGLLYGILLARVVAGGVGDLLGWRALYGLAAAAMVALGLSLRGSLPHRAPSTDLPYPALMRSLYDLLATQPVLRRAAAMSGLSFASFTAFWTTLSFLLADRFHLGATAAGLFGFAGAAGAWASPAIGHFSDRRGPAFTIGIALLVTALSFAAMDLWVTLPVLIVGVVLMDLGIQSYQVAAQARVIALIPTAGSRLNTLYMVGRFAGGAAGSALGAWAWTRWQWHGLCGLAVALNAAAGLVHWRDVRAAAAAKS
ncbi:MAG TPA: MFS transporter [Candidatus Methylacidiphilales bacterium]